MDLFYSYDNFCYHIIHIFCLFRVDKMKCKYCLEMAELGLFTKKYIFEAINCFKSDCPLFNPEQVDCQ